MNKNILFGFVSLFATQFVAPLSADWEPEYLLYEEEMDQLDVLFDEKYLDLKARVKEHLRQSWCSTQKIDLLMDVIVLTKPAVCVEIGTFTGSSILPVAAALHYLESGSILAVDAWANDIAVRNLAEDDCNKDWWSRVDMGVVQNIYDKMIIDWSLQNYCKTLHMTSSDALQHIEQIDFLHLDGDYSEIGAIQDVQMYLPKVKSGGYILLSNLYMIVNGKQPKLNAYYMLLDECEMIIGIENDSAVLFRKR